MASDRELPSLAARVGAALLRRGEQLVLAESCTGGLIATVLTDVPGASAYLERGFVVYSNRAKSEALGVDPALIVAHGAVSEPVALALVAGALRASPADWAIAVTGIAGPGGGSAAKPVGTVWLAWGERRGAAQAQHCHFAGDRAAIREAAAARALRGLLERLGDGA